MGFLGPIHLVDRAHDGGFASARNADHDGDTFGLCQAFDGRPLLGAIGEALSLLRSQRGCVAKLRGDRKALVVVARMNALLKEGFAFQNSRGGKALALDDLVAFGIVDLRLNRHQFGEHSDLVHESLDIVAATGIAVKHLGDIARVEGRLLAGDVLQHERGVMAERLEVRSPIRPIQRGNLELRCDLPHMLGFAAMDRRPDLVDVAIHEGSMIHSDVVARFQEGVVHLIGPGSPHLAKLVLEPHHFS